MQVTETKNDNLAREYTVTLPAQTISEQTESRLQSMGSRVKIAGFRPLKVPLSVLKKRFGKDVMGEVIEQAVGASSQQVLRERNLRPAMQPKVEIVSYQEGGDLSFRMEVEVMPSVPEVDFSAITLEKMVCEASEKEIDDAVTRLAERNKTFTRAEKGAKAQKGSQLLMDFVGKMDGVAFEGGTAKGFQLELGSGQLIDGFEDQLIGAQEGADVTVRVTFPAHYHKADLAGKPAEFDVHVHEVRHGEETKADDAFAAKLGFTDLGQLRKAISEQFARDYENSARAHMKKQLFDILEKSCAFPVPKGMLDVEFAGIWEKLQQAKKEGDEVILSKSDEALRTEYMHIAERRVKLGILLSDVAVKNKIQVNQDELSRAVMQQAGQFPGQERRIFEFYQKNPGHLEELRGPILEEKAVDFIFSKAKVNERKVTSEELMKEEAAPEENAENKKPSRKKKAANE